MSGPQRPDEDRTRAWSQQHGDLRPSGFVGGWLRVVDALAAPLVRLRVPADAVTVAGAVIACLAVPLAAINAAAGAGAAVLASGLLDGLDGAVARGSGRSSAHGARLDRSADRVGEVAAAAALVLLGAPWWLALAAVLVGAAMEGIRAGDRRRARPARPPTVGERPTRVLVAGMFALAEGATAGWSAGSSAGWSGGWSDLPWAGIGAAVWLLAVLAGLGRLAASGTRGPGSGRADETRDDLG